MAEHLCASLISMGPAAAQNFHNMMQAYKNLADQYGLWDAASIVKEYGCSDDGFIDFRAWLIAQGKEVYMNALKEPDTLADIVPYGNCSFERMLYVGNRAYKQLTGRSAYDDMDRAAFGKLQDELRKDIVYKDGIQYPREPRDLPDFLPHLCEKHGGRERFQVQACNWNFDLHEIRRLLDEGKRHDKQAARNRKKRGKGEGAR